MTGNRRSAPPVPPAAPAAARPASLRRQLASVVLSVGAPIGLYYALRAAGLSSLTALAIGAVVPGLGACYGVATRRRIDSLAALVLVTMAGAIVISYVSDSPRFLLAKEGLLTSVWGLWFLASVRAQRPAAFRFARPLMEGRRALGTRSWDDLWAAQPRFRRIWRVSSVLWGVALLVDAVIRVVMAYTLPVDVVPGLGGALWPVTVVVLQVVSNVYYHRAGLYRLTGARWSRGGPGEAGSVR